MLYAFAILSTPILPSAPVGISSNAVNYLTVGDLVAVVEPNIDIQSLKQSGESALMEAVVTHDRVICELFTQQTLLPLRFGTVFISEAALQDYLRSHQQEFLTRLQRLTGYAEYLLKGNFSPPKLPPEQPTELKGKDYLLAKRSQYLQQQELRSLQQKECNTLIELFQAFQPIQIATPQDTENFRAYLLLNAGQAQALEQILTAWQAEHQGWQINLSEGLPPYHFVDSL